MPAIVHQADKRSGITYAYESISYWDKEKQQSRAKRRLIGRVYKETGEIVSTDGRGKKKDKARDTAKRGPIPTHAAARYFYGATYLFDAIGDNLGVTNDVVSKFA